MNPRSLLCAIALSATVLLSLPGCRAETPVAAPTINAPGVAATSTAAATISIVQGGFVPRTVTIKQGDRVTWTNDDTVKHNVGGTDLVSGVILPGASYTHTFVLAGTYQYLCTFHPDTEGQVEVVPR